MVSIATTNHKKDNTKSSYLINTNSWLYHVRCWVIKLSHWEYWSFHMVYAPMYFYWLWMICKARDCFFFMQVNPGIEYSGFYMESKYSIYQNLPKKSYPSTSFIDRTITTNHLMALVHELDFSFPMVAKPDIGERGVGVQKINSMEALLGYHQTTKVDYILQAWSEYPHEIGLFYYRLPHEKTGHITGIVGKEFLTVIGNGKDTIETLLANNDRGYLQLKNLQYQIPTLLSTVLPLGKQEIIVPYGNHARGTKFINLTHIITPALLQEVQDLCSLIPGFYYGRLDIRYQSLSALQAGKAFTIIELNGAGSEPTHIYDPQQSICYAWKEIIRHYRIMYKIYRQNAQQNQQKANNFKLGMQMIQKVRQYKKQQKEHK